MSFSEEINHLQKHKSQFIFLTSLQFTILQTLSKLFIFNICYNFFRILIFLKSEDL